MAHNPVAFLPNSQYYWMLLPDAAQLVARRFCDKIEISTFCVEEGLHSLHRNICL